MERTCDHCVFSSHLEDKVSSAGVKYATIKCSAPVPAFAELPDDEVTRCIGTKAARYCHSFQIVAMLR